MLLNNNIINAFSVSLVHITYQTVLERPADAKLSHDSAITEKRMVESGFIANDDLYTDWS